MSYQRYPNNNRVVDRDRIYLDDYVDQVKKDTGVMIGSVGDTVKILKDYKVVSHEIDHIGTVNQRGSHGGRRQLQPKLIPDPLNIPAAGGEKVERPYSKVKEIVVPAIVDLSPSDETRQRYGFMDIETGTAHISSKYLIDRGIYIDSAKDYIGTRGEIYKIMKMDDFFFLDNTYIHILYIKKDM